MSTFEMEQGLPADERIALIDSISNDHFTHGSGRKILESSNFQNVREMVLSYLLSGDTKREYLYLKDNGKFNEKVIDGIRNYSRREVIVSRFAEFNNHIAQNNNYSSEVNITDDLPKFTWHMKNMFLPEYGKLIFASCLTGIIEGWNDILSLISRPQIPIIRIPKRFEEIRAHMLETSRKFFPDTNDIVLPTRIPGASAKYYYSEDFELPYMTLEINNPAIGNLQVTK